MALGPAPQHPPKPVAGADAAAAAGDQAAAAQQPRARSLYRRGDGEEPAARSGAGEDEGDSAPGGCRLRDEAATATRRRDDPGADELMLRGRPTTTGRSTATGTTEALETDSFADVGRRRRRRATKPSISTASNIRRISLAEHLLDQLHGAVRTGSATLARSIAEMLDETGYLTVSARRHRRDDRRRTRAGRSARSRSSRTSIRPASARAPSPNAWRCRPRRPTATTRRWRG